MKSLAISALLLGLSGCVVAPLPHSGYYGYSGYAYQAPAPVYYAAPSYPSAYIWEPSLGVYYYRGPRGRVYMQRGWRWQEHERREEHREHRHHD
jgi:hypothetical protein